MLYESPRSALCVEACMNRDSHSSVTRLERLG